MRIWGGLADMTPDMAPVIEGKMPIEGLYLNCGWGYFGFKSCAVTGKYLAEYASTGNCPEILKPFSLRRFKEHRLMGETEGAIDYGAWN